MRRVQFSTSFLREIAFFMALKYIGSYRPRGQDIDDLVAAMLKLLVVVMPVKPIL